MIVNLFFVTIYATKINTFGIKYILLLINRIINLQIFLLP